MKKAGTDKGSVMAKPSAAELAVQEIEQRYLGLLEISGEAILIVCESRIVFASAVACELLGVEAAHRLLGLSYLEFIRPKYRDAVAERMNGMKVTGQTAPFIHRKLLRADGKVAEVEVALHACGYHGKLAVQVLMRDVTERRRLQAEVTRLAQYDPLTELANRSQYRDRLDGAIARAARNKQLLGVLCLGVDHFRAINDTLGQQGGDVVLMQVAERLKRIVRKSDTVARLGGDEFSVILEGLVEKEGAGIAAQRNLLSLAQPYALDDKEISLTVSIGIAVFPHDAQDLETLLRKAIMAMNYAKQRGRNNFQFYSEEMDSLGRSAAQRRADIGQRLESLTPREREVLDLLIAGKASKMIAYMLGISARTIDIHRARVMEKMQADSLAELVHMMRELQA
jgi:diguanylate cyclase (GGDEF)-like protein/PAS domain S-box-containing protein